MSITNISGSRGDSLAKLTVGLKDLVIYTKVLSLKVRSAGRIWLNEECRIDLVPE